MENCLPVCSNRCKGRYFFVSELAEKFSTSAHSIRNTRTLAVTAMFVALNVTLDLLNLRIQLTPDLRIGVGFLANAMVGMLFGPSVAMMAGASSDILGWLVNPGGGAYFPGFTITAILAGVVWGCFLYKEKLSFWRCLAGRLTISLVLNIGLNSVWKLVYFGKGYTIASLVLSVWKNLLLLLPEALLLFVCAKLVDKLFKNAFIHR